MTKCQKRRIFDWSAENVVHVYVSRDIGGSGLFSAEEILPPLNQSMKKAVINTYMSALLSLTERIAARFPCYFLMNSEDPREHRAQTISD